MEDPESSRTLCVVVIDHAGRVVEWNPAAERTFGFSRRRAVGAELAELIIPSRLRGAHRQALSRHAGEAESPLFGRRLDVPALRADGTELAVELTITRLSIDPLLFVGFMRDVSEGRGVPERLERAERRYRELIERLPVVAYLAEYGEPGRWHYVSPEIERMLGYTVQEWLEDPTLWNRRLHPDDLERVMAAEERCAAQALPLDIEYRLLACDGRVVWVRDKAAVSAESDGRIFVEGILSDVTDRKRAEAELRYRAEHDELTGLFNGHRFEAALEAFRSPGGFGALAIFDVDHLKLVNDSLGQVAGDTILRGVAARLHAATGEGEILARLGGDEFAVLLPRMRKKRARTRAAELLRLLRSSGSRHSVTASAGIVLFESHSTATAEDLFAAAERALQEAKAAGGDRFALFSGHEGRRLAWVGKVRTAIDAGRLVLHSQPIFSLRGNAPVGEELFVRMLDDDGSLIPPRAFLPTAERFGLIRELDRSVVTRAARLAAAGRTVAINLSALSIGDRRLTEIVSEELAPAGADAGAVIFEITETAAVRAIDDLRDFAARVERAGCWLASDDFGTGFGSLTYLRHLPVHYLKIDMEFVQGMARSIEDQRVVKTIVTIAEELGMRTVAEGVEDAATLGLLREYGVDFAQGFHLGRPAPVGEPAV